VASQLFTGVKPTIHAASLNAHGSVTVEKTAHGLFLTGSDIKNSEEHTAPKQAVAYYWHSPAWLFLV
jgi:hypothetical protein